MPDITEHHAQLKKKQAAIEVFLNSLVASARTTSIYKPGHPMILQIAARIHDLLLKTLGTDSTLTLDIKAKTVVFEEEDLAESREVAAFASALHTLGIGQILFTNRLSPEGLAEFFRVLLAKPDEKTNLTELQKAVQNTKIDGLQMTFVLSFVVTGEQEENQQKPGQLTEEQIGAFLKARTLSDFLALLLHQNEGLIGKDAEKITDLLDGLLHRELSVEKFQEAMPWSFYDPRIRERWDQFAQGMPWEPKWKDGSRSRNGRGRLKGWGWAELSSWAAVFENSDLDALQSRPIREKPEAMRLSLEHIHGLLTRPTSERQPKYSILAYARLVAELGRDGGIPELFAEFDFWQGLASHPDLSPQLDTLQLEIRKRMVVPAFTEQMVQQLDRIGAEAEGLRKAGSLILYLGEDMIPLLLEELRKTSDKSARARLSGLLVSVCGKLGAGHLFKALADEDWFLVSQVILILGEVGSAEAVPAILPTLKHKHPRVREAAVKVLAKSRDPLVADGFAALASSATDPEEACKVVIALSLLNHPSLDFKLIGIFEKTKEYKVQVAVATALGRIPTERSAKFLLSHARRTWYEIATGRNKELRATALRSLQQIRKERKG